MAFHLLPGFPDTVPLTNALAKEFAEMTPAPGDREEREWRREEVLRCVKEGTFRPPEWVSVKCKETGIEYRENGKHTSRVFAEMNGSLPKGMKVILSHYICDDLHDVAALYNTFDKSSQVRSARDNVRAMQMTHPKLAALPTRYVALAVSGIAYERWEHEYRPQDEKSELMFTNVPFCGFVHDCCGVKDGRPLARAGVVAAIFKTWQRSQSDAKKFWMAVRDGTGHPASVADRAFQRWLLTTCSGGGNREAKKKVTGMHQYLVEGVRAWNAWRKGQPWTPHYKFGQKTPAAN